MANPAGKTKSLAVALVGGETLLGHELQEFFKTAAPAVQITSYAATGEGNFGEEGGEAIYREPLEAKSLAGVKAILVAGTPAGAAKAYDLVKAAARKPTLLDCTGDLDHQPEARIVGMDPGDLPGAKEWLLIQAHPVASALALTLQRLSKYMAIRQAIIQVFQPASELGKTAVSELHQQTVSLLAFKSPPKKIYDAQLSFNLLAAYGEDSPYAVSTIERRIETHLATLLSRQQIATPPLPMPSLRVIQAPVFHGYSLSAWIEFEGNVEAAAIEEALASAQIEVRGSKDEAPNSVDAAGQSGLIAGDIRVDRNNGRAAWLWIAADNLRLTAEASVSLINRLKGVRA